MKKIHFVILSSVMLLAMSARKPNVIKMPDTYYPCSDETFWWAVCMSESNCNPKSVFKEPPPLGYESLGLYQTSPEDHARYPECSPRREDHLTVEGGTSCKNGIVKKLRRLYPGLSYQLALGKYWAVLRGPEWGEQMRPTAWGNFVKFAAQKGCAI